MICTTYFLTFFSELIPPTGIDIEYQSSFIFYYPEIIKIHLNIEWTITSWISHLQCQFRTITILKITPSRFINKRREWYATLHPLSYLCLTSKITDRFVISQVMSFITFKI